MVDQTLQIMPIATLIFRKNFRNIDFVTYMILESNLFITIDNLAQGTTEWHEWRREVIGASDAPVIMGENPWKSRKTLIEEKLGIREQFSGNAATRRGSQLEPEARRIYTSLTNTNIDPAVLQSKTYLWQAASIDGINATKKILVEIKCGVKSYEYTEQTNKVPLYYRAQLQHILCVTGFESINYFSYLPGKIPLSIKVFRDEEYIQELISAELEFIDELKLRGFSPRNTIYGETNSNSNASCHAKQTVQNGNIFEGSFVNGKRNGYGVYTWANGDRYEGNWIDGNRTGKGIYTFANGLRYEGDLINGVLTGKGIITYPNGGRYEGDCVNGKPSGKGTMIWGKGQWELDKYEGDWIDGKITGNGIYTFANGGRYEGNLINGVRTGKGIITYANGDRYEGDWINGTPSGKGTKIFGTKVKYEGFFENGEAHGAGKITWPNGDVFEGIFQGDLPNKNGRLTLACGEFLEGIWDDGFVDLSSKFKAYYTGNIINYRKKYLRLRQFSYKYFDLKLKDFHDLKKMSDSDKYEFRNAILAFEDEINSFGSFLDEVITKINEDIQLDFKTSKDKRKELVKFSFLMRFQFIAERLSKKCVRKMYQASDEFKFIFEESVFPDDLY